MKMLLAVFAPPLALLLFVGNAFAQSTTIEKAVSLDEVTSFILQKERDARIAETKLAPIRSRAHLSKYLEEHPRNAFQAFSERSMKLFIESLTFNELGLTGFRTYEMETELSPRQAFSILSLFGVSKTISSLHFEHASDEDKELLHRIGDAINSDYPEYRCIGRATCRQSLLDICIGSNCIWVP